MFSRRLPWPLTANRFAAALDAKRAAGVPLIDLTDTNPTRLFEFPAAEIAAILARAGRAPYDPQPRGLAAARDAVAAWYARRGLPADPARIVLTAGTSEAYALLFKLLADPDDAVLVPRPGYPLFEHLAALEGLRAISYALAREEGWRVDLAGLGRALDPPGAAPRALIVVNPNNPTGSVLHPPEREAIRSAAAARDVALIADEVFVDYVDPAAGTPRDVSLLARSSGGASPLTFVLGGLSKACGMPQLKLAWIVAAGGAPGAADEALRRLELIADTYLTVGTPVQAGAADLLALGDEVRGRIVARIAANRAALDAALRAAPGSRRLPSEGGWHAVVQVPAVGGEEDLVLDLLERDDVVVHPGYFFDFDREAFLVLSLLPEPDLFAEGVRRIAARVDVERPRAPDVF